MVHGIVYSIFPIIRYSEKNFMPSHNSEEEGILLISADLLKLLVTKYNKDGKRRLTDLEDWTFFHQPTCQMTKVGLACKREKAGPA